MTKVTPGTEMILGRKSTRESSKVLASPNLVSKKAKGEAPVSASLKAKNAYNKHLYTKSAQDRMHDFERKTTMAEKR